MAEWSIAPVIDWLLHKGRLLGTPELVVGELCTRLRAQGMPRAHAVLAMQCALDALRKCGQSVQAAQRQVESELYFPKRGPARLRG